MNTVCCVLVVLKGYCFYWVSVRIITLVCTETQLSYWFQYQDIWKHTQPLVSGAIILYSNHTEQSTRSAKYMPRRSCDRTRLAPRKLKQHRTNVARTHKRVGGREPSEEGHGARGCTSCWRPFSSEHPVMSPGWRTRGRGYRGAGVNGRSLCFWGLLTDGKACRLHRAIFSCKLVCRFSDAGPGEL